MYQRALVAVRLQPFLRLHKAALLHRVWLSLPPSTVTIVSDVLASGSSVAARQHGQAKVQVS